MSLSSIPLADSADTSGDADTVPDRIVRACSRCARPLSVGERMFYFLEAVNTPALCRICVLDQERQIIAPPSSSTAAAAPLVPGVPAPPVPPEPPKVRLPPPRRVLPEFPKPETVSTPDDLSSSEPNGSLPSGARQLRLAASHYVEEGRLDEAIECIRELALEIGLSRSGTVPVSVPTGFGEVLPETAHESYGGDSSAVSAVPSPSLLPANGRSGRQLAEGIRPGAAAPSNPRSDPV